MRNSTDQQDSYQQDSLPSRKGFSGSTFGEVEPDGKQEGSPVKMLCPDEAVSTHLVFELHDEKVAGVARSTV